MIRRDDWVKRLVAYVTEPGRATFEWGSNDCITFAAGAVEAVCGENLIQDLIGSWSDEKSAKAELEKRGGLKACVESKLGAPLRSARLAQRGDVAIISRADMEFLAVCVGDRFVTPTSAGRYFSTRLSDAVLAWPVGR